MGYQKTSAQTGQEQASQEEPPTTGDVMMIKMKMSRHVLQTLLQNENMCQSRQIPRPRPSAENIKQSFCCMDLRAM